MNEARGSRKTVRKMLNLGTKENLCEYDDPLLSETSDGSVDFL